MIRAASTRDLNQVIKIEKMSFPNPWHKYIFYSMVQMPGFFVYELKEEVVGYIIFEKIEEYVHIINISVHPLHRNKGIGSSLLQFCINCSAKKSATSIFLEVREKEKDVQKLYKMHGFRISARIKDYYPNDHALLMERNV